MKGIDFILERVVSRLLDKSVVTTPWGAWWRECRKDGYTVADTSIVRADRIPGEDTLRVTISCPDHGQEVFYL